MKDRIINYFESRHNFVLLSLLVLNFLIKILCFYNTTSFYVSETASNYGFLTAIENGEKPALYVANYRSILAYIGYFFKTNTGSLIGFFWFQALISTVSVFILYLVCLEITKKKIPALFSVLLATIYMDYHLLTPVFYYQVFEIFFNLIILYLVVLIIEKNKIFKTAGVLLVPVFIYLSVFFRDTLRYYYLILLFLSLLLVRKKDYELFARITAAAIISLILFLVVPQKSFKDVNKPPGNDFMFFGHTLYGGDGGEGSFIYEKNKALYEAKLKDFMIKNNYDSITIGIRNEFQNNEMKEFISKSPHKWLFLQIRKVAYTFGIVPVRDSLELLTTGKMPLKWYISTIIIQVPYILILCVFIILMVLFFDIYDLNRPELFLLFLVFFYLIAGTCLYGQYQERYRHVIVIAGIIPISSIYLNKYINSITIRSNKSSRYFLLCFSLLLIFSFWGYQAYDVLVLNKERYFDVIKFFQIDKG